MGILPLKLWLVFNQRLIMNACLLFMIHNMKYHLFPVFGVRPRPDQIFHN